MHRRLFLLVLSILLAACSPVAATPARTPGTATGSPVVSATDTTDQTATSTHVPPALLALPAVAAPALIRIDFQDASDGWGIAANGNGALLRTVDGGRTWLNASPSGIGPIGFSTSFSVLDVDTVWLLETGTDFFNAVLYRTRDGGVTWTSNPVPFGAAYLQFLDSTTGRALADRGAAAGSGAVELYQTGDGGVTWTSAFHNNPDQAGSSDSLPFSGIKNGLTFTEADTGWVTGSRPAPGDVYLFVTHDGGTTWSQQTLPLLAGGESDQYVTQPPVFFGADGFLPLKIYPPDGSVVESLYITHDGGATWSGDPSDSRRVTPPGLLACADALHAWSWDGGPTLYSTGDGARSWSGTAASPDPSGKLYQLDFTRSGDGTFVGWALTGLDETGHSTLYRTDDNGATWTPLVP